MRHVEDFVNDDGKSGPNVEPVERSTGESGLSALTALAILGALIAGIGIIVVVTSENPVAVAIWSTLIGPGVIAMFLALVAYVAVKAILTNRR